MTLEELIKEGLSFKVKESVHIKKVNGKTVSSKIVPYIENKEQYSEWIAKSTRFIAVNYPNDIALTDFKEVSKEQVSNDNILKMVGILRSLISIPQSCPSISQGTGNMILNITQTQVQSQSQQVENNIIINAIRNTLSEEQIAELRDVIKREQDSAKANQNIFKKLKDFGANTLASIIANIITNPTIWQNV